MTCRSRFEKRKQKTVILFLLVVKLSVSGKDWPSSYRAKTATEYSVRDASSRRS